tara:strand:- start:970 stop:1485 length:516 start_codon:yes stop_codon:yes gene_type:complete
MPRTKSQKRAYQKMYYEENREKMKSYQTEYQKKYLQIPKNKEWKKNYMQVYQKTYSSEWQKNNPEKVAINQKRWREKNLDKFNKYMQEYRDSDIGKRRMRVANWRQIGIEDSNFNDLYDFYMTETNCMICDKEYKDSRERHLDHDHESGEVRYICCRTCNIYLLGNKINGE